MQDTYTMNILLLSKAKVQSHSKFANTVQLDYKRISQLFGHGATYNSIECRFRPIRKLGERLRNESTLAPNGSGAAQSPTPRKPRAPKRDKVKDDSRSCLYTSTKSFDHSCILLSLKACAYVV